MQAIRELVDSRKAAVFDRLYIGGEWVEPRDASLIESINPATGKVWAHVPEAREADIDRAVAAARQAFESAQWSNTPPRERGKLLRRLADAVRDHVATLALLETRDNGKAIRETLIRELPAVAEWLDYFAGMADKVEGTTIPVEPGIQAYTTREPIGVVGAILPWNSPLLMVSWKLGPAIAAGNTVVLKPAELTSVSALVFAQLLDEVGFPPGVVNVVPGLGATAGEALSAHPGVDKIAFTGEASTARLITRAALGNLKRLSFELGGKAPHIVFADAEVEFALDAVLEGAFIAAGQTCAAGSRILVERSIYDDFVGDLVSGAQRLRVGNPEDEATHVGAQTSEVQIQKTERYVEGARADGAAILCGGARAVVPGFEGGFFYLPTVIADIRRDMEVWCDEIFGPVVVVMPFDSEDEAIRLANDTRYGLTAGIWTSNIKRAHRVTAALRAGTIWINTFRVVHWAVPFGGVKESGYGREHGFEVMQWYTEPKSVFADHRTSRTRWFAT